MMTVQTACEFCKRRGLVGVERNTDANSLVFCCLHCGQFWSASAVDYDERCTSLADRRRARRTERRQQRRYV